MALPLSKRWVVGVFCYIFVALNGKPEYYFMDFGLPLELPICLWCAP